MQLLVTTVVAAPEQANDLCSTGMGVNVHQKQRSNVQHNRVRCLEFEIYIAY
jgi:hypothetical protein